MSTINHQPKSHKPWRALLAALGMTLVLGLTIIILGVNALFNKDVTPAQAAGLPTPSASSDQATIQQLQDLVLQYQAREQQYQTELQQAASDLNQANAQLQQYQGIVTALENAGIIQTPNGQVFVGRGLGERSETGDD